MVGLGKAGFVGEAVAAVLAIKLGAQVERAVMGEDRKRGDRRMAGAAERAGEDALGGDCGEGRQMVDGSDHPAGFLVGGAALDPDRALRRGGEKLVERVADLAMMKPVEPGGGEQGGVAFARRKLGQPCVDIAANGDDVEVGADAEQLRGAARGRCADDRALLQIGDRGGADQPVAGIGAAQHGGDAQLGRAVAFDVLHRMHRNIGVAGKERSVEFLGPQRLAADIGQRSVLDAVAGGLHHADFDRAGGPFMRNFESRGDLRRLGEGERGAASAKDDRSLHGATTLAPIGHLGQRPSDGVDPWS